jgi:hypothetical protein
MMESKTAIWFQDLLEGMILSSPDTAALLVTTYADAGIKGSAGLVVTVGDAFGHAEFQITIESSR